MNYNRETIKRRNHSFDILVSVQGIIQKKNINARKSRNNSYFKEKIIPLKNVYTTICKKFYPLINVANQMRSKKCNKHFNIYSFFCLKCETHFCSECLTEHIDHSFLNLDEIQIKEKDIISQENSVCKNIYFLFKDKTNKNTDKRTKEKFTNFKNEIIKFNYFIIDTYKKDKNNFYNFYNYYYLYKLKDELKTDKNDLLKKYFALRGFKTIIKNLKFFYEKQKHRWLLKNLIEYKKNEIIKEKVKKRKNVYRFENLDTLMKDEGYNEEIIKKMKDIIIEVKDRNDLKMKIFNFMISAVDVFRNIPEKLLKELNVILEQVKINFKEMVKQNVGNSEDVKKFIKSKNSSYYVSNNDSNNKCIDNTKSVVENNKIIINEKKTNYIYVKREKTEYEKKAKKEYDLYNGFNINSYGPRYLSLDISNTFKANNNNNNYIEVNTNYTSKNNTYISNEVENIYIYEEPKKKDILNSLFNVDKKYGKSISVDIDTSNIIKANNNNNKIRIVNNTEVYENNTVTHNTTTNYNKNIYDEKPKTKKEISDKENIDNTLNNILNNEIKKNDLNNSEPNVYTTNYRSNLCKVNNNNCEISLKNTEKVVKNTDIVINNENNFNDYEKKSRDKDIEFKSNSEIKDQNNNRILLEEKKLRLDNKEVKIKKENNLFVDKIEIKDKLGSENKNYINKNEKEEDGKREEEERRRKEEEERRRREEELRRRREEEERRRKEEEERRRKVEELRRRFSPLSFFHKPHKYNSNTNNRICNKCYSNCDMDCRAINYLECCAFNGNGFCKVCGCYQIYHERSYYFYLKNY